MHPLCMDPPCDCGKPLETEHPNDQAPLACFACRVFWDLCAKCNVGTEAMRLAPVVGFGRSGTVAMLELPALPSDRYYALSDDCEAGVWVFLCDCCGHTSRWARDGREAVVAEDFSDPRHFAALAEEQARIRRPPPHPKSHQMRVVTRTGGG